ncbi:MAG: hypothetical protein Ct9H90mP25_4970 [Gammaproteobacteria bacterium]|nr:MAG: hypothetical protein Ct9H90mP25_4970 [Gammaproteobacteria bacterium]
MDFSYIPQSGEFGNESWLDDSWAVTGATNILDYDIC